MLLVVVQLLGRGNAVCVDGVRVFTQDVAQLAVLLHQTLQIAHALVLLLHHHLQPCANLLLQLQHAQAIVLLDTRLAENKHVEMDVRYETGALRTRLVVKVTSYGES